MKEFERIYNDYFADIYKYMRAFTGSDEAAAEITQETFFKAMRSLNGFRNECDVRVWLCRIAKNCWYTSLKKEKRSSPDDTCEDRASSECIEADYEKDDAIRRISAALDKTPEPYREVFALRVYEQLSFAAIGAAFGKSEHWACVTYHRAKDKIRAELGEE